MMEMEKYTKTKGIDRKLRELIKIRALQINGCAFCLNMHTADARKMGETKQRIYFISAWEGCEFYTNAEKVALKSELNIIKERCFILVGKSSGNIDYINEEVKCIHFHPITL